MRNSWTRYNENPTVITVQKDYRYWYLPFPSTTFCYVDPVDEDLAKDYIQRWVWYLFRKSDLCVLVFCFLSSKWKVSSGEKFEYYMEFVKKMANSTYENFDNLAPYVNNTELMNIDIIDLMLKVLLKTNWYLQNVSNRITYYYADIFGQNTLNILKPNPTYFYFRCFFLLSQNIVHYIFISLVLLSVIWVVTT